MNEAENDLTLWQDFRRGDADAFSKLIKIYYKSLFSYGKRFTKDEGLVKDCIQDLFLVLWKNHATIGDTHFVKYYLLKSYRRILNKEIKKWATDKPNDEIAFINGFDSELPFENQMIVEESLLQLSQKIRKKLSLLSKRQQEIIYLRFYMDAEVEEIAQIMSINRQSVYNLLHDALKKLKHLTTSPAMLLYTLMFF